MGKTVYGTNDKEKYCGRLGPGLEKLKAVRALCIMTSGSNQECSPARPAMMCAKGREAYCYCRDSFSGAPQAGCQLRHRTACIVGFMLPCSWSTPPPSVSLSAPLVPSWPGTAADLRGNRERTRQNCFRDISNHTRRTVVYPQHVQTMQFSREFS